jgi:hypothetical protein
MMGEPTILSGRLALRRLLPAIGLLLVVAPAAALAQTNIDQGKSPAELFAGDCATCHKSARGLANGRGSAALAAFLLEHYTASRDQAAALAAYVLGAGGGQPVPATQSRGPKTTPDKPDRAAVEESKPGARPRDRPKREETPATARARPGEEEKREGTPRIMREPNGPPARKETEPTVVSPTREATPEPAPPASPSTPVVTAPSSPPPPAATVTSPPAAPASQASSAQATPGPSAAAPGASDSGEGGPVPRDNIPD